MNEIIRFTAHRAIFVAETEMADMALAIAALKQIAAMNHIDDLLDPLDRIDAAIKKMPEFSEDLTADLLSIRKLLEAEITDPLCNGCGLTAMVATEGGQGEARGCKCNPQAEEDAIDLMRDDMESVAADMIEYQRTER